MTQPNIYDTQIYLSTTISCDVCVCTMGDTYYSLNESDTSINSVKKCHIHTLGSLTSVVFQTSELCQKWILLKTFLNMSMPKELFYWNNIFLGQEKGEHEETFFQIASTHLCSLGSYNFNNFVLIFLISLNNKIYLYNGCIQFYDSWDYKLEEPVSIQSEHFIPLFEDETLKTFYEKPLNVWHVLPLLSAVKLCHHDAKYFKTNSSQTILVCYITGTGYIRCLILSLHLDDALQCLKPTVICISSCLFLLTTLGYVTKITVGSSVIDPESQNGECLFLLSGSKRCALLKATYLFSSAQILIQIICIGQQVAIENTVTDVEPFYTGLNPLDPDIGNITYTLCTRSNNRLWLANLQGHVERTLKIKSPSFGHIAYCHNNYLLTWDPRTVTKICEGISIQLLCLSQLRAIQNFTLYSKSHASSMRIVATSWDRHAKQAAFIVQEFLGQFQNDLTADSFLTVYILSFTFHITSPTITQLAFANLQPSPKTFFYTKKTYPSHSLQPPLQDFNSHQMFINKKKKHNGKHVTTSKFSIISTLQMQPFTIAWYTWYATRKRVTFVWHTSRAWWKNNPVHFFVSSSLENMSQHVTTNTPLFPAVSPSLENMSQHVTENIPLFSAVSSLLENVSQYQNKHRVAPVSPRLNHVNEKFTTQVLKGKKIENQTSTCSFDSICINHYYSFLNDALLNNATFLPHSSFLNTTFPSSYAYSLFVYFTNQIQNKHWMTLTHSTNFFSTIFSPTINNALSKVNKNNDVSCFCHTGFLLVWQTNPVLTGCSHTEHVSLKSKETQQETVFVPLRLLITLPYDKKMHLGVTEKSSIIPAKNISILPP